MVRALDAVVAAWVAGAGCASPQTVPIASPGPCVCEPKPPCDKGAVALGDEPRDVFLADDSEETVPFVPHELDEALFSPRMTLAARADAAEACKRIEVTIAAQLADAEPAVFRKLHELRAAEAADDAAPPPERKLAMWRGFEATLAAFEKDLAVSLRDPVQTELTRGPRVTTELVAAVEAVYGVEYKTPGRPKEFYVARATTHLRPSLTALAVEIAGACAAKVVETNRGRWVAVLRGKA